VLQNVFGYSTSDLHVCLDGRIIKFVMRYLGVDWIHLAQGSSRWRGLVCTEMNYLVP
jgi:hypothetical protein